ncbi:MAG: hypothetical protein ACREN7_00220 [Candidatus Dormibacteria bacterium]
MALRFADSFDHYATPQITQKWTGQAVANAWSIVLGGGRESGAGALYNSGSAGTAPARIFTSEDTWTVGMAVNLTGLNAPLWTIYDSSTNHIQLTVSLTGTGAIQAEVEAGTYTSDSPVVTTGVWAYIEAQIVISATVGTVTVKVNGVEVISETGIDTAVGGTLTADTLIFGYQAIGQTSASCPGYYDDLYLCDGTGSYNNTFLGNVIVQALRPVDPGSNDAFTPDPYPNWANVNDDTPDGDSTANSSGTTDDMDSFKHDAVRPTGATILGIQHVLSARTATSTSHSLAALEYTGATAYPETGQALQTAYQMQIFPRDTDPATSLPFTEADLNAAEFGYELTA